MNSMKLRVCLTDVCNFKCIYCHPSGEGCSSQNEVLSDEELYNILNELALLGIESFRLTGGEPMLRKNFFKTVEKIKNIPNIKKITMVTNGSIISEKNIEDIVKLNLKSITVSLDTLDKEQFKNIVKVDCLEKVINSICILKKNGIKTKINMVVTKDNEEQIYPLIIFAIKNNIDIKLLDLFERDSEYWKNEFVTMDKIVEVLNFICDIKYTQKQDEGFGIPEDVFEVNDTKIVIKNSSKGTCYCQYCYNCNLYPCQTGIVSFVLTHDGLLKLCTLNQEKVVDAKRLLYPDKYESAIADIKELFRIYNNSQFQASVL